MARFAPAFVLSAALSFGAGGALGQTVADYEAAVAAAPVVGAPPAVAESYCRLIFNYVLTAIPGSERTTYALPFFAVRSGSDANAKASATCEELRRQPVIAFNAGTGEEIVTPPRLTDPVPAPGQPKQ